MLGAVLLGAAACGVAVALPLWLLATRATRVYNWLVVAAAAGVACALAGARLVRAARRAPSAGRYLRAAAGAAAQVAARGAGVAALGVAVLFAFARWGTLPGLLALPPALLLAGVLLFARKK